MVKPKALLGGSGVVISGVISPLRWVLSIVTLLITLVITTHEPPSMVSGFSFTFQALSPRPEQSSSSAAETLGFRVKVLGLGFRV